MMINSILAGTFLFSLLLSGVTQARTFYNTDGKSIEAELVSVENNTVVMKLSNGRVAKVPITKLSTASQNHVKRWWQENKNRLTDRDVKISIRQKSKYTKRPETKIIGKGEGKIKTSEMEYTFLCKVDNYAAKTVSGIKASYSVHKRISKRGKGGSSSEVKIITNTMVLDPLESHKYLNFTTDGVKCNNLSNTLADISVRESIIGMVLTLSVNGKEILSRSHPENLLRRFLEDEKRDDRNSVANDNREERKDIADGKRYDSIGSIGSRGDSDRNDRLSNQKAAREERLRKEKEARKKRQEDFKKRIR